MPSALAAEIAHGWRRLANVAPSTEEVLVAAYDRMLATPLGTGAHTEASTAFFRTLSIATGNIVLGRFIRETSLTLERNLQGWAFIDVASDTGHRAGQALRRALLTRNAARADAVLRAYQRERQE